MDIVITDLGLSVPAVVVCYIVLYTLAAISVKIR